MRFTRRILASASLAMAATLLAACKAEKEADPRAADRLALTATVRAAHGWRRAYTGVIEARVQSNLGFRVQGKVVARLVDAGQTVKAGQPLMRIDRTDYEHALTAQAKDVEAVRARWIQAAADEKRYRSLVPSGAVARTTYDQAKAAADSSHALMLAAEAQEKVARNQGNYSVLVADADGTIVETLAEPGQVVAPGQLVVRLAHAGPREAVVNLPETERPSPDEVAEAKIYGGAEQVSARLRQLSDSADPRTRTFEARYVLDGAAADSPLGATVTLRRVNERSGAQVGTPLGALIDEGSGPGVWVLDAQTLQVSFRPVEVARLGADTAILNKGPAPGETIIACGGHFLHEGERVRVATEKATMQ